jgi:hypothetical protein
MTKEEEIVYKTLCPSQYDIKDFSECPIPIRVLQVFQYAKSLNVFTDFKIWCAGAQQKDPVLVAWNDGYTWNAPFILARWGDVLDNFDTMVKKTIDILKSRRIAACKKAIKQLEGIAEATQEATVHDLVELGSGQRISY